ncbi:uncharacterized protein METZ01_LOCUS316389, partial [marine metagenome]
NVYWNENNPQRYDNAINEYKIMLDIDPEKYDLYKKIGHAYNNKNDFDNAIQYYEKYSKIFVDDSDILSNIAGAYLRLGNYEQSISSLEDAILLSNEEIYLKRSLLHHKYYSNNIDAIQYINDVTILLEKSENDIDSMDIYYSIKDYYVHIGEIKKSFEYVKKIIDMHKNKFGNMSSMDILLDKDQLYIFKHLNMMDSVKTYLDYYAENTVPPYDNMVPYIKCLYYLYTENYEMLATTTDDAESGLADF